MGKWYVLWYRLQIYLNSWSLGTLLAISYHFSNTSDVNRMRGTYTPSFSRCFSSTAWIRCNMEWRYARTSALCSLVSCFLVSVTTRLISAICSHTCFMLARCSIFTSHGIDRFNFLKKGKRKKERYSVSRMPKSNEWSFLIHTLISLNPTAFQAKPWPSIYFPWPYLHDLACKKNKQTMPSREV